MLSAAVSAPAVADGLNTRAALGGGLGGALGAFVGSELGGQSGAVLGGGLGGALGSVIATDGYGERRYVERHYYHRGKPRWRDGRRRGRDWDD
jgi:uncharacterized membrane protein